LRKLSAVLMFQMIVVRLVFRLEIVDIGRDNSNCGYANIVGYFAPKIRGFDSMVDDGLLLSEESSSGLFKGFRGLARLNSRISAELRRAPGRAKSTVSQKRHEY